MVRQVIPLSLEHARHNSHVSATSPPRTGYLDSTPPHGHIWSMPGEGGREGGRKAEGERGRGREGGRK